MKRNLKKGRAFFAVKRRGCPEHPEHNVAPIVVAFVESYDDGIAMADRRNTFVDGDPFYVSVHHG